MYTEITIRPRFCETDANGHINNTVPTIWLEEGRSCLIHEFAMIPGSGMIAHVEIDYLREMRFNKPVTVRTGIDRIGEKSYAYYQEIWQNEQWCIRGKTVTVGWDRKARATVRIADEVRAVMAPFFFDEMFRGRWCS